MCRFDPRFLHLDTQFCIVRQNLALACIHCLTMPVARTTQDFGSTASGRVAATLVHAL